MNNREIARVFEQIADLLELIEGNPFRIRAYRNAAWTVAEQPRPLKERLEEGEDLTQLQFIGKDMARAIAELTRSGRLDVLDELAEQVPLTLPSVMRVPGIGPNKARRLWRELGVVDVDSLEEAAREGRVAGLSGFGKKTEDNILRRIQRARDRVQDDRP